MRIAVLLAALLLVVGCSTVGNRAGQTTTSAPSTPGSVTAPAPSTTKSPAPSAAPQAGAPISAAIAWIEAARPADAAHYHSATRDGVTTDLGRDIAFTASGANVRCMTDAKHTGGTLSCLVHLTNPPPRPAAVYGGWRGGWVDFDGTSLQVGSGRADPGPFTAGDGAELASGQSLEFGDFRCRSDEIDVFCVNYAHRSAVRLAAAGIQPFGCLQPVPPLEGIGQKFSCSG
ncbi:RAD23 family protein [Mycobacterium noviomagense]|uniref:Lipoprotein LppI n=1 Tax=Mycobacterium noviomagense TaxID=459858 RepID=A0A7I7PK21_9MYCO|nr:hypothetical protein [Mycobacterium noviomagense]ORB15342.1 hypothetical protein BST37_09060 [Mycobacterium noviomagense]BBY08973.1 hypothetical protein MNVI_42910 [Mycobacterium noviomagense]